MSNASVQIKIWDAGIIKNPATIYTHITTNISVCPFYQQIRCVYLNQFQARYEYPVLTKILDMVERSYEKGVPKHHLETARSLQLSPNASSVFVVTWDDFLNIPSRQVQDIFRHRHILVTKTPIPTLKFDEEGLSTLAPLQQKCFFQGSLQFSTLYFANIVVVL
jgi:hypothetical protein